MRSIIPTLTLLFCIFLMQNSYSQVSSRNGFWIQNSGTIRVLLVFAEVTGYAWDTSPSASWPAGDLPVNADDYFDHEFTGVANINGFMTDYFYQASFGNYIVLGDYVDDIFSIDQASLSGNGDDQVFAWLNSMPGADVTTNHGHSLNNDFDMVTTGATNGVAKTFAQDDYIDMVLIMWRTNSNISTSDNSGSVNSGTKNYTIKGINGFMSYGRFISYNVSMR